MDVDNEMFIRSRPGAQAGLKWKASDLLRDVGGNMSKPLPALLKFQAPPKTTSSPKLMLPTIPETRESTVGPETRDLTVGPKRTRTSIQPREGSKTRSFSPYHTAGPSRSALSRLQNNSKARTALGTAPSTNERFPLATTRTRGDTRAWPSSYYSIDIFDGLKEKVELSRERNPRIKQEDAFRKVFPGQPFAKSTYNKANNDYRRNRDLEATFCKLGRSNRGTWTRFITRSIAEAGTLEELERSDAEMVEEDAGDESSAANTITHNTEKEESLGPHLSTIDSLDRLIVNGRNEEQPRSTCVQVTQQDQEDQDDEPDPQSLCPYCDEPYPEFPSTTLQELHRNLDAISKPDPFGGISDDPHALHLKVYPHHQTGEHCERHRVELKASKKSDEPHWPAIDFDILPHCIVNHYVELRLIMLDPTTSPFHTELMESLVMKNSNNTFSIQGEYESLEVVGTG